VSQPSQEANTIFTVEHPIRTQQDYQILLTLLRAQQFSVDENNLAEARRILGLMGSEGIVYTGGPSTPIMDLTRNWVGLEQFIYHLSDFTPLVESVLDAMAESCYRQYELIASNTPCEALVFWDDVNTRYISPTLFRRYSIPVMRRYAEIAHAHGKILVCHTCGHIAALLKLFLETGVDAIDWVTPPPAADVDPKEAQRIWGDQITMMLSVAPDIMRRGTAEQVETHIRSLLDGLDLHHNLVFMLPPPVGTPLENVRRAVKLLADNYGVPVNLNGANILNEF
jgi:uroporphyrinogen-III decarboxylase